MKYLQSFTFLALYSLLLVHAATALSVEERQVNFHPRLFSIE
jgi:hypothetical protein